MTNETDIDSIRALEDQIREHRRPIIELKRVQNSLLNVSRLPPEVLGDIFCRNVIPEQTFGGFERRSYNFLLVCHHWFEVASCTPDLWSFWGNNLRDWTKQCLRYPAAPVDLVLDGVQFPEDTLDISLRKALQDRAAADTIRRIHLLSEGSELLSSIILPLTANFDGIRSSGVESIIIRARDRGSLPVDISDFFAHYCFPKLRSLELTNCAISSWDLITSRTSLLTTLDLFFDGPTPDPTTSQLISIFSSNPGLQSVRLTGYTIPDDDGGMSSLRVPLCNLEDLDLSGDLQNVVRLLHCLDHARNAGISLSVYGGMAEDIPRILGPYLRGHLRHRGSSPNGLDFSIFRADQSITLYMGSGDDIHPELESILVMFIFLSPSLPRNLQQRAFLDLIADTPREEIVSFRVGGNAVVMGDVYVRFPNLTTLYLTKMALSSALPRLTVNGDEDILPSLQHVVFEGLTVDDGDWGPLTEFLSHRASSGNRLASLTIVESSDMHPEVAEGIRDMVGEFTTERFDED